MKLIEEDDGAFSRGEPRRRHRFMWPGKDAMAVRIAQQFHAQGIANCDDVAARGSRIGKVRAHGSVVANCGRLAVIAQRSSSFSKELASKNAISSESLHALKSACPVFLTMTTRAFRRSCASISAQRGGVTGSRSPVMIRTGAEEGATCSRGVMPGVHCAHAAICRSTR